ncbi:MAG: trypsin-like peptidase domain-containing protein [Pseudomonadota bacterium]
MRWALCVGLALAALDPAAAWAESCRAPEAVCAARAAVFPVESHDPLASATRIGPDLLVTNRHVVADRDGATLLLPDGGRLEAEVVASAYPGDLALLRAAGLPSGPQLSPAPAARLADPALRLYVLGVDTRRRTVRAHAPGQVILAPAQGHALARLHHSASARPGTSGGALVDQTGALYGIVTSGGEGRNEAVPAAALAILLAGQSGPKAAQRMAELGRAYRACERALDRSDLAVLAKTCRATGNRQFLELAGQALGRAGELADSAALLERAVALDPHALNSRLSLAITYVLMTRPDDAAPHLAWLIEVLPADLQILNLALQTGVRAEQQDLAVAALAGIERYHPQSADPARRFFETAFGAPE